ncbi:MAG: DUF4321 domain-containing protein [Limnochordaceae bacterium]|nr:DUF4321 domain-containing protein [Limnochordaceae bacterium]
MLDRGGRGSWRWERSGWWWTLVILTGGLVGSWVGEWLGHSAPILSRAVSWGFRLEDVHLGDVLHLQLGLTLQFNLMTVAGMALAAWLLRRY